MLLALGKYFSKEEKQVGYKICTTKLQHEDNRTPSVLVMVGAFNPITILHLRLMENAKGFLEVEKGWKVVGGYLSPANDGYVKEGLLKYNLRSEMVKLACDNSEWIMMDDWPNHQKKGGKHVFCETTKVLKSFKSEFEKLGNYSKKLRICFLCGADLVKSFSRSIYDPKDVEDIVKNYFLCVSEREGTDLEKVIEDNPILKANKERISLIPTLIRNDMSSSKVRKYVKSGYSPKYWVDDRVMLFIKKKKLYKGKETSKF